MSQLGTYQFQALAGNRVVGRLQDHRDQNALKRSETATPSLPLWFPVTVGAEVADRAGKLDSLRPDRVPFSGWSRPR